MKKSKKQNTEKKSFLGSALVWVATAIFILICIIDFFIISIQSLHFQYICYFIYIMFISGVLLSIKEIDLTLRKTTSNPSSGFGADIIPKDILSVVAVSLEQLLGYNFPDEIKIKIKNLLDELNSLKETPSEPKETKKKSK